MAADHPLGCSDFHCAVVDVDAKAYVAKVCQDHLESDATIAPVPAALLGLNRHPVSVQKDWLGSENSYF